MSIVSKGLKPTIKASFVSETLEGYVYKGGDADALLESLGYEGIDRSNDSMISVYDYNRITDAVQSELQDEMLGFTLLPMPLGSLGFINRTMTRLPTLKEAFSSLNEFYSLFNNKQMALSVEQQSNNARISLHCHSELQVHSPFYKQRMLLGTYKQMAWLAKSKIQISAVAFSFPVEVNLKEFRFVFACDNVFQADNSYIEFSEPILSLPVVQATEGAETFSEYSNFYTLLWPNLDDLVLKIRVLVGADISNGFPTINVLAEQIEMSPQTLSRKLSATGTTYQAIKDEIRQDISIALLRNSKLSIKEIAFKVGFKESSAFSKTFKQWYGMAPGEYRNKHSGMT